MANISGQSVLHPEVIRARVKQVYESVLTGRQIIEAESVNSDAITYMEEGDIIGKVDYITEEGGFPDIQFKYGKKAMPINPYGVKFDVFKSEVNWGRIKTVGRKIDRAMYRMRAFEDNMIYYALRNAVGVHTIESTDWTDYSNVSPLTGTGDPLDDLEIARDTIVTATDGIEPDIAIMSYKMFRTLAKYEFVKNQLYTSSRYAETGLVPSISGLRIIRDNKIDPQDVGQIAVLKSKQAGVIGESIPMSTMVRSGDIAGNPMLDNEYYNYAQTAPVIDSPEVVAILSLLYGN